VGLGGGVTVAGFNPNSKTAAFCGGVGTPLRFIVTSALIPCLGRVKFAFFSAGLNVVSSWSIIGAGSAGGVGIALAATVGIGVVEGLGMILFAVLVASVDIVAGCFAQPMSETVSGFTDDEVGTDDVLTSLKILGELASGDAIGGIWNLSKRSILIP